MINLFSRKLFLKATKIWMLSLLLLGTVSTVFGQQNTVPDDITCGTQLNGSNSNAANDYTKSFYNNSNCNLNFNSGFSGKDVQYILDIPQSGKVTIQLYSLSNDLDLFLYRMNSNGSPTTCAATPSTKSNRSAEKITATLNAGKYLVIIDAYASNIVSSYTLKVDCENLPQPDCCDNALGRSWLKNIIDNLCDDDCKGEKIYCATYDGQPAIHITPSSTCTDQFGYVYNCDGDLLGRYGGFGGEQLPGTLRNIKLLWTTANCEDECINTSTDCYDVNGTPKTPKTTENGNYACLIDCIYEGDKKVTRWEINGRSVNTISKNLGYTVNSPGKYTICVYFECDGRIYKCCTEVECPPIEDDCSNTPTDCDDVSCTPRTPKTTESGNYSCSIDCSYTGGKSVRYWKVNGQRFNTTNKNPRFTANRPGKYTICTYYECDGRIYKCCREVECPQIPDGGEEDCCYEDLLSKNWVKNFMEDFCESDCTGQEIWCATYNGQPAIHITPSTTCTDQNGYVYDCNGNELDAYGYWIGSLSGTLVDNRLLWSTDECHDCDISDDFEEYSNGTNISSRNPSLWKKWSANARDGRVSRDRAKLGNQSMEINRQQYGEQDVILRLGNKTSGQYRVAWNMYINQNDQAYFNIQANEHNLIPRGVVHFKYESNDYAYQRKWLAVELYFDLDRNKYYMFFDGREVAGGNYRTSLGGINFYATEDAHFYIDNICVRKVSGIPFTNSDGADSRNSNAFSMEMTNTEIEKTPSLENRSLAENNELSVYPNPSKGFTTVKLNLAKAQAVQLNIINQTGQLIRTINLDNTQQIQQELDLSDLPNGLYFIKANGDNLSMTEKIIIQR